MIVTVDDLQTKLRSYIGTPFHHAGRSPGIDGGLDCGGLIMVAMQELGMHAEDPTGYQPGDGIDMLRSVLEHHCIKRDGVDVIEPGDLLLLRGRGMFHHLVFMTTVGTIIHAWQTTGVNKVVETDMLMAWWDMIDSVWRLKELENWQQ